jgi:hypothetical protein
MQDLFSSKTSIVSPPLSPHTRDEPNEIFAKQGT